MMSRRWRTLNCHGFYDAWPSFSGDAVTWCRWQKPCFYANVPGKVKAPLTKPELPGVDHIIAVASGKGGVGKSSTAVNLAVPMAMHCGLRVGILDADVYGPSVPTLMKLNGQPTVDLESRMIPLENYGVRCMSMGFLVDKDSPVVWRGPMELRKLQELQKALFVFLHSLVSSDMSKLLLNESTPHLNEILQLLLDAFNRHNDVLVRKICIQVLAKLITEWCGNTEVEEKIPGFRHFVLERFARDCIYNVLQSSFNLQDANTVTLLGEIGSAQRIMYEKCGEEFLMQMATKILPSAHCPPNLAEQYCLHMQRSDGKDLKAFYKSFIEKLRPEYNNNVVAR